MSFTDSFTWWPAAFAASFVLFAAARASRNVRRGMTLALNTRLPPPNSSCRVDEVRKLRSRLEPFVHFNPMVVNPPIVLVHGPRSIGKTHMIATATARMRGVKEIRVINGDDCKRMIDKTYMGIANTLHPSELDLERVKRSFRLFTKQNPVVILNASDLAPTKETFSQVVSAARALSRDGLCVIIDGGGDYLPFLEFFQSDLNTIELEPLSEKTTESIPQFASLFARLKDRGLYRVVMTIFGDNLSSLETIRDLLCGAAQDEEEHIVETFMMDEMHTMKEQLVKFVKAHPEMINLLDKMKERSAIPAAEIPIESLALRQIGHNDVLRRILSRESLDPEGTLIPSSAAMAMALRFPINEKFSFADLKLVAESMSTSP